MITVLFFAAVIYLLLAAGSYIYVEQNVWNDPLAVNSYYQALHNSGKLRFTITNIIMHLQWPRILFYRCKYYPGDTLSYVTKIVYYGVHTAIYCVGLVTLFNAL